MNRGCVSVGEIKCDSCKKPIEQGQRYLLMEGDEEEDEGKKSRFCMDYCLAKEYAAYIEEKGEQVLTFFPTSFKEDVKPE